MAEEPARTSRRRALARAALIIILGFSVAALVWPGPVEFTAQTRPFLLGLPYALAWNVAWVLTVFMALLGYHLLTDEEG